MYYPKLRQNLCINAIRLAIVLAFVTATAVNTKAEDISIKYQNLDNNLQQPKHKIRQSVIVGDWIYPGGEADAGRIIFKSDKSFIFTGWVSKNFKSYGKWEFNAQKQQLRLEFRDRLDDWKKFGGSMNTKNNSVVHTFQILNDKELDSRYGDPCRWMIDFFGWYFDKKVC